MKQQKTVTIKDIARRLGISHSTVSRALADQPKAQVNPKTQRLVREMAAEMDYSPNLMARGVVTGKSGTLGLLTYQITAEGYAELTQGLMVEAHKQGYQILFELATSPDSGDLLDNQQLQIQRMISRGVDGLMIHTRGDEGESERILKAVASRVPVVTFSYPVEGINSVVLDRISGFYETTEHLIRLGHREIGFIGPGWNEDAQTSTKGRGYYQAMQNYGLTPE